MPNQKIAMPLIPVVDIFAGPGGLGEGFASFRSTRGLRRFGIVLSVEKDRFAHETLLLRSFYRRLDRHGRDFYWDHLRGNISREELFRRFPRVAASAREECLQLELGPTTAATARTFVRERLRSAEPWVLVGGPPCQAYSLAGRARNKGNPSYRPAEDHRQTLYVEYLQILSDQEPSVFVMENVKGLLSATFDSHRLFDRIREDLSNPALALRREGRRSLARPRYRVFSLVDHRPNLFGDQPHDYVVKSEAYGIPQRRHRVILLGVREDAHLPEPRRLIPSQTTPGVQQIIDGLPRVRSGITDLEDNLLSWRKTLSQIAGRSWVRQLPYELRSGIRENVAKAQVGKLTRGADCLERQGRAAARHPTLNHSTRAHIQADLERYLFAGSFAEVNGRSPILADFPAALLPRHANVERAIPGNLFSDRFRVQVQHRPATTITSHISKDGHYYIHYDASQCRSFTVREAAMLQTFPDDYFFCGPRTAQYQQVGNAVPPRLAAQIARIVDDLLE